MEGKIEYGNICHHIEELKDNQDRILDIDNLIYVTERHHNMIHSLYDNGKKELMQKKLFELVNRWKEEINK